MAQKGEELNTRLTVDDRASAVLDGVAADMADLEDVDHIIDVGANTGAADSDLSALDRRLAGLTDDEKRVVLSVMEKQSTRDLDAINRKLANAEKYDDTEIEMFLNARGDLTSKIDQIQTDLRAIDGETVRVDVQVDDAQLETAITNERQLDGETARVDVQVDDDQLDQAITKANQLDGRNVNVGVGAGGDGGGGIDVPIIGGLGARAAAAGGVAGGAALLADSANNAKELAIQVQTVSNITGDSLDQASRLVSVWRSAGYDVDELVDLLLQMNDALASDEDLAKRLGVNLEDGKGAGERFIDVLGALKTDVDDVGERGQLSARLFGEEGVRQVAFMETRIGDLKGAIENVPKAQIIDEADVERAQETEQRLRNIKAFVEGIRQAAGTGLLSGLDDFISGRNLDPANIPASIGRAIGIANPVDEIIGRIFGTGSAENPTATGARPLTDQELANLLGQAGDTYITNYQISPTPAQIGTGVRDDDLWNAPRPR